MSKNRQQNLLMKKNRSDGIDATGALPRSKSNSVIEPVATSLEERNLYGDKYICTFVIFTKLYVCHIYLPQMYLILFFLVFVLFVFFFYFYKKIQEYFFYRNSFPERESRKYVNKCSIQENKKCRC